ncbi:unnamed protein product, partial [Prorocentrum cordatum]
MAGTVDVESQKRIKALRKKLSQIEKLKEKEADTLTPEEAAKIEGEAKILSEIVAIERGEAMPRAVVQEAPAPAVEKEAPALAPAVPAAAAEAAPAASAAGADAEEDDKEPGARAAGASGGGEEDQGNEEEAWADCQAEREGPPIHQG